MRLILLAALPVCLLVCSCVQNKTKTEWSAPSGNNPLLETWNTPYGVPPFDTIKEEHYQPAIEAGIAEHQAEIEKIASNPAKPTFTNTIEALDQSGQTLRRADSVFDNLMSADTNDQLQAIAKELAPKLSKHSDDIRLNEKLFARIKTVYEQVGSELTGEQAMLLEKNL